MLVSTALLAAFSVTLSGSNDGSTLEDFWQSLLRTLDTGTMAADVGWGRRLLALVVTVVGLLIAGTLIGIIANGVEQRAEQMRRGRSRVVETDHVVVLGASTRLPILIEQLALAGMRRRGVIVVLADQDPADVAEMVRAEAELPPKTKVVYRRGDPTRRADLKMVAIDSCRSVICLASDEAAGDAEVVKEVLAAGAELGSFDRVPIVAELNDPETTESLMQASGGAIHPLVANAAIARITEFALREPGLNQVVQELVDFRGSDIYVYNDASLEGQNFGEVVFRFAKARPIGLIVSTGDIRINPDPATVLSASDHLVIIADHDQALEVRADRSEPVAAFSGPAPVLDTAFRRENMLVVGWNALGSLLLGRLAESASPGSRVEVVYDPGLFAAEEIQIPGAEGFEVVLTPSPSLTWRFGDLAELTSVVLLGYRRGLSVEEADSRTLLNLMQLRREATSSGGQTPRVIVEMLAAENVELARMTGADDYVVSDAIASRLMAQLAELPARRPVLLSLYAPIGPSIHLMPMSDLGLQGSLRWVDVVAAAYERGLLAIGWRDDEGAAVVLNPPSDGPVEVTEGDQLVVIG